MLGIRRWANSRFYTDWAREQGVWLFTADDITERGAASVAREALEDAAEMAMHFISASIWTPPIPPWHREPAPRDRVG